MPLGLETLGRAIMGRARRGLYAGRHIGFGNKVSEDGGNKSRRSWKPNTHFKRLYSQIMEQMIRFRVTTHALRCIDKVGGIDEYLLNTPDDKLDSDLGLRWKRMLEQTLQTKLLEGKQIPALGSAALQAEGGDEAEGSFLEEPSLVPETGDSSKGEVTGPAGSQP